MSGSSGERQLGYRGLSSRTAIALSVLINAVLFASVFSIVTPAYETTDDPSIMMIASGAFTGEPSAYLYFTSIAIGFVLKNLYSILPSIPWYAIYIYAAHGVAMIIFLFALLRGPRPWAGLAVFLILFFGYELRWLIQLQFTSTAALCTVVGIVGLVLSAHEGGSSRSDRIERGVYVGLLILGAMIRKEAFYMVFILAAPALALIFLKTRSRSFLRWLGLAVCLCLMVIVLDSAAYWRSQEWNSYTEIQLARHVNLDFTRLRFDKILYEPERVEELRDLAKTLGWSHNDLYELHNWFFPDSYRYLPRQLREFGEWFEAHPISISETIALNSATLENAKTVVYLFLLHLAMALALARRSKKAVLIMIAVEIPLLLALQTRLFFFQTLPERVAFPMFFTVNAMVFVSALREPKAWAYASTPNSELPRGRRLLGFAALLILSLAYFHAFDKLCRDYLDLEGPAEERQTYIEFALGMIVDSAPEDRERSLVFWLHALPLQWISPFGGNELLNQAHLIPGGWMTFSPHYYATLRRYEIDDVMLDSIARDDIDWLTCAQPQRVFAKYIRQHTGKEVEFEVLFQIEEEKLPEGIAPPRVVRVREVPAPETENYNR